jgi:hypothetical protein
MQEYSRAAWSTEEAQKHARIIWNVTGHKRVILLGRRVANAFCVVELNWFEELTVHGRTVWALPHPTGSTRWWNSLANRQEAQAFLFPLFVPALQRAVVRLAAVGLRDLAEFYARLVTKGISHIA